MSDSHDIGLRELSWDSDHFGIRVGELSANNMDTTQILSLLDSESRDYDLVYVRGADASSMTPELLDAYCGQRTDVRATFSMAPIVLPKTPAADIEGSVRRASRADLSERLFELAIVASAHSRFRSDRRISPRAVDSMYCIWIEQALLREDEVGVSIFVYRDRVIGFHVARRNASEGQTELIAVDPEFQGKGVGFALNHAGLSSMCDLGLERASVATQSENPACEFYRRCGYELTNTEDIYHLWPRADARRPGSSYAS